MRCHRKIDIEHAWRGERREETNFFSFFLCFLQFSKDVKDVPASVSRSFVFSLKHGQGLLNLGKEVFPAAAAAPGTQPQASPQGSQHAAASGAASQLP